MIKLLFTLLIITYSLSAQIDKSSYYSYGESLYSEVIELPNSKPDSSRIVVLVKAANEVLNFKKVKDGPNFGKYFGMLSVEILFKHESGIVKKRVQIQDTVLFDSYEKTLSKSIFVEGYTEVLLARDEYNVEIEFDIKENSYLNKKSHKLELNDAPMLYTPLLLNTSRSDVYTELNPFILNQTISFDAKGTKVIIPANSLDESNYTFTFTKKKNLRNSPLKWDEKNEVSGICNVINSVDFQFNSNYVNVNFDLKRNKSFSTLDIDIPGVKILPGVYQLLISKNNQEIKSFEINIDWTNRPISLNKLSYAVEMMKYMASEQDIETLSDSDDMPLDFLTYWKPRDPTPTTPFNEAIQQYYERVDFAFFNFKTISESDGADTDRGKIFILKASPSEVVEEFIDNRTLIVWKYPTLKKEYVFELIGAGDYRLVEIKEI